MVGVAVPRHRVSGVRHAFDDVAIFEIVLADVAVGAGPPWRDVVSTVAGYERVVVAFSDLVAHGGDVLEALKGPGLTQAESFTT